ncbi:ATP-binding protein [Halovenus salina]|uniref:ATP-binding protein n=1 Tax=Halovenus salina TaxID=1510225 RepID=UPI002260B0D7|nr:DUF87 domain-containing protein [Halovenus salina]
MGFVIGRTDNGTQRPTGHLGEYRALDGSAGATLSLDLDTPHAMLVVGKRGYGKSYTLGVIAEELARATGVAPVVIDPMGVFETLADTAAEEPVPADVVRRPTVPPNALDPKSWCSLLDLTPESGPGSLLWQATQKRETIAAMQAEIAETNAPERAIRSARNHLDLADSWGIFDANGLDVATLTSGGVTVLDVSGLDTAPMNAVCRGVAQLLYRARVADATDRLPWLLVDEAHAFFDGGAESALELLLTRGRAPGVSLVTATQRPSAIPAVGISQSDILVSHRLTAADDLAALETVQPTYLDGEFTDKLPTEPGAVLVVDDATETVHAARIRSRATPHGGESPRASELAADAQLIEE